MLLLTPVAILKRGAAECMVTFGCMLQGLAFHIQYIDQEHCCVHLTTVNAAFLP